MMCKYSKDYIENRERMLIKKYNITLAEYDEMFEKQNGVCKICGLPELMRRLSVDHDHRTDKIRGLLCDKCNLLLGRVESATELVVKMLEYLNAKI